MCERWTRILLESEQKEEGHHETKQSHGLRQGETQNGIGEELLFQRWIASIANDEGSEDASNTSSRASNSNGGSSSSNELGSRVNVPRNSRGLQGTDWSS